MRTSYHTHTARCLHAYGSEDEYISRAIDEGFVLLGFADHCPWPYTDGYVSSVRMLESERADYEKTIRSKAREYQGQIEIPLGYECEYFPKFIDYLRGLRESADFIILGNHYLLEEQGFSVRACETPSDILRYAEITIEGMRTGLFDCVAHPDLYMDNYKQWDSAAQDVAQMLCQAAKELSIPLEYNLYGLLKILDGVPGLGYPCEEFWREAARQGCEVIIGCDSHRPSMTGAKEYDDAEKRLTALGVNLIKRLHI